MIPASAATSITVPLGSARVSTPVYSREMLPPMFLRAKLLPPRPAPALLPRPRLTARLDANLTNPVTLVTANAGSGKTTLVADFVRSIAEPFVWYQLDQSDADPVVFLSYLAMGIQQIQPEFGAATLAYLKQSAAELSQQPERAVDVLLNELLDGVDQHFVLVLDDYHHLGPDTPVHGAVDRLLQYLPDVTHTIVISRDVPPLGFARMRSKASLEVIDRADLLFTDEETRELFRNVFGLELTAEQLTEYRERTHGWITALQLVRQFAERRAPDDEADLVDVLRQSERDIFEYFAEEVFADEPEEAQQLLLHIALLDRVELDVCSALFPDLACARQLPQLVRRNVFLTVAGDGGREEYRLHPLFQAFLRRRARSELGASGVSAEHARCAELYIHNGRWKQAIQHLEAAGDHAGVAAVIARAGAEWIAGGALGLLVSYADALPAGALDAEPYALFHRAEAARLQGDHDTAVPMLRRAAHLFSESGDAAGEAEALHSLATVARRMRDFDAAIAHLDRVAELSTEDALVRAKSGNTRGLILKDLGQWTAAEAEFRAALELGELLGDDHYVRILSHNLGLTPMMRGDFSEALRWLRRLVREEIGAPLPQEATANLNVGRCLLYRGDTDACEHHLDRALELCQLFNLVMLRGEIFEAYGNLHRERLDVKRAEEFYERAERAYEEAGIEVTRRELLEERALLALGAGDATGALGLLDRLVAARAAAGDEVGFHTASLSRGCVLVTRGDFDAARKDLEPSLAFCRSQNLYYYEAQASLALAACEAASDHEKAMLEHLGRAVDLALRYDYEYWLEREVSRSPGLFASPDAAALLPADLREKASEAAGRKTEPERSAPVLDPMPAPVADLTINMLGVVEIFRDPARAFAPDAWVTRRARDILCFVASRPYRRATKDVLVETFWGEAEGETVQKNFHPTVSYIRKALNSRQPLKLNFLVYRDGEYMLSPDHAYRIDVHELDRLLEEAETARRARDAVRHLECLEAAVALYRGEFMEGCYDEWTEEPRAYYREQALRALETLAVAASRAGDWGRSLDLAQRILREDGFREDVHCLAMRGHAALGNRGAVHDQFEALRRLLDDELGVEPARDTKRVYDELMQADE